MSTEPTPEAKRPKRKRRSQLEIMLGNIDKLEKSCDSRRTQIENIDEEINALQAKKEGLIKEIEEAEGMINRIRG